MRKIKRWILCFIIMMLLVPAARFTVYATSDLQVTADKTLTAKFNKYDNVRISKDTTLTLGKQTGEPVGLEINKSLVVEEGGKITGDGILIFDKNATYSGITLYYNYKGELKKIPPVYTFAQLDSNEDYRPEFIFDSKNGVYVLKAEYHGGDPFELGLSENHLIMLTSEKHQLNLSGLTEDITWKSSKKSVATVSKTGMVTAKKTGRAVITAVYDGKEYFCEVEVVKKGLNADRLYMKSGEKFFLMLHGTKVKSVASSKKTIAKINKKLEVTAVSQGKCTIAVRGMDGKRYKCTVIVED